MSDDRDDLGPDEVRVGDWRMRRTLPEELGEPAIDLEPLPEVAIDRATVVALHPDASWVSIGDEVVVYVPVTRTSHVLDHVARMCWQSIDGSSDLGSIFDRIAERFGVPTATVADDFLPLVAQWRENRMIELADGMRR